MPAQKQHRVLRCTLTSSAALLITLGACVIAQPISALANPTLSQPGTMTLSGQTWVDVTNPGELLWIDTHQSDSIASGSPTTYLQANILLSGSMDVSGFSAWTPFGTSANPFVGTLNGEGNEITNLTISSDGFIGSLGTGGTVENVGISTVTGTPVGALVGDLKGGTITDSYSNGGSSGSTPLGGLVNIMDSGTISGSHATGEITGPDSGGDYFGGLVGWQKGGTILDSYASGTVSGAYADGGLVGLAYGSITDSYADGSVSGNITGGLVGSTDGGSVQDSYATGSVSGTNLVGGLVGEQEIGPIRDSYAIGSVSGASAGGLVGMQGDTITDSYAIGAVSGPLTAGFVAEGFITNPVDSFFDTQTTNQSVGIDGGFPGTTGVTGETSAAMKSKSTYTVVTSGVLTTPWDFTNTWAMQDTLSNSINSGYPYLTALIPTITNISLNNAQVGENYNGALSVTGGYGTETWYATGLPTGISLNPNGVFSGSPSQSGAFPVTITVRDGMNLSDTWTTTLTVNPLTAPTGLSTTLTTTTSTTLAWTSVSGATGYDIFENGSSTPLFTGVASSSYTLTGLTPDTTYAFAVSAVNGGAQSVQSSVIHLTTAPVGNIHLSLSQTQVTSGQSVTVSGVVYDVYGNLSPGVPVVLSASSGLFRNAGSKTVTADVYGGFTSQWSAGVVTQRTPVTVTATVYGVQGGSTSLSILPPVPGTPTNLNAGGTTATGSTLTWTAVAGATSYNIYENDSAMPLATGLTSPTYTSSTLTPATQYSFTVSAVNDGGESSRSAAVTFTTLATSVVTPPATPTQFSFPPFTGVNGFDILVSQIWMDASGTNWFMQGPDGTQISVQVPNGTLNQQDAIRLTSAEDATLTALTKGLKQITVLGGYGLSIANDIPSRPIEFWFANPAWVPGTMVYRVNQNGSLTWIPVETLSSGWLRFSVTPGDLVQGGNFVMVLPDAVKRLKFNEGLLEWNGIVQVMPTVQSTGTTYAALYYIMEALKQNGVTSHWNGKAWTMTTSKSVIVQATTDTPKSGDIPVIVNGTTVAYIQANVGLDRWTHRPTTYLPIHSLDDMLNSVFGIEPDWTNGTH